ncbi:MAG TPA: ATP-binding protein [Opitutaceae bacterium]|nr:ATP-binding protein [Opitutaceae bacterium]
MPHPPPRFRPGFGAATFAIAAAGWLLGIPFVSGQAEPPTIITRIDQYWTTQSAGRREGVEFSLEADVTYSDPAWGHVWLQDATAGAFFGTSAETPLFPAGQRVRITGRFPSERTIAFTGASLAILGPARTRPLELPPLGWHEHPDQFNDRLVRLEAYVDRQSLSDPEHLHLFLSADGHAAFAWVLLPPGHAEPQLAGANVRIQGVFTLLRTNDGTPHGVEVKVGSPDDIEILSTLDDDPRFALPVSTLASLRQRPGDALVHVVGYMRGQQPGRSLMLRDDSGQIEVLSGQSISLRNREPVEAIGYPEINGTEWKLRAALYRPLKTSPQVAPAAAAGLPELRLAGNILELSAAEADRHYPVSLYGVVTWSHPDAPFFFLQDSSGGIEVRTGAAPARSYEPGRSVVVEGTSVMGSFAPTVAATTVKKTGDMPLPRAEVLTFEHALTGQAEAEFVEMRGLVRKIHRDTPWHRLELTTSAGDFSAFLPAADAPPAVTGAVVRLRGVCTADTDTQRRIRGVRLWVHSARDVQVEEEAPRDLFALPAQSLAELGRFGAPPTSERRVRLSGVVLAHLPGHWVQIQDGDVTLRVLSRDSERLAPGQRIDAVGYLNRKGGRVVLREAACRVLGPAQLPPPISFSGAASEAPTLDGRLVVAEGQLLNATVIGAETRLNVLGPGGLFVVLATAPFGDGVPLTSRVRITGLLELIYDEQAQPAGFRLRPRSASDLVLLKRPSWFTPVRALTIAGALACGVGLALVWIAALRRRVRLQTGQLREQMMRETRLEAELQRATRLESLGLLAGGIAHDFNNLLTVIVGNISMANLAPNLDAETSEHLHAASRATMRARDLTQQLLTFAKGGAPVRTALSLPEVVQEVAGFVLRGTAVSCEFDFQPALWPAHVDKGQISQVVQNLVINAVQSMPDGGRIRVALRNEEVSPGENRLLAPGKYLHMSIADTGSGIAPEILPRVFDPYFTTKKTGNGIGLATVHSIIRKHGGHISLESTLGVGTTFHLHLPASDDASPAAGASPHAPPPTTLVGRILLMDDEADIRRLATQMMQRLGLEVHSVADGAAAIDEYVRAIRDGRPYNLVVLDLTIPGGIGGLQALGRLREIDPEVRAVVSSGYSEDEVMASYRSHGFLAMVSKPYSIEELARVLRPLLCDLSNSD